MKKYSLSRRRMLKTLGVAALSALRFGRAHGPLLGQPAATEKEAAVQPFLSVGNAGVPLMWEVWGRPPGMDLPEDLRKGSDMEFEALLKESKEQNVDGIEYYVSWGFAEPWRGNGIGASTSAMP